MPLPRVLMIDDSEAVLAYGRAVLGGRYAVATARNGSEGLERARALRPAAILLDLSMPELDGEGVLAALAADPELRAIPVIVVSSERARAERCLGRGAVAVLHKPAATEELVRTLEQWLGAAHAAEEEAGMAILTVAVGRMCFALPLASVTRVAMECATTPLAVGPSWLSELVYVGGAPVCIVDVARRLGARYAEPRRERKLVFVHVAGVQLGLRVDRVYDPERVLASQLVPAARIGGAAHRPLNRALLGVAHIMAEPLPIIDPAALLSPAQIRELAAGIAAVSPP
ncbi:MAG TPA: response regulator [Kofleriaceae bacterium]|nr:response regulator [Kofleriaceae bacterium]